MCTYAKFHMLRDQSADIHTYKLCIQKEKLDVTTGTDCSGLQYRHTCFRSDVPRDRVAGTLWREDLFTLEQVNQPLLPASSDYSRDVNFPWWKLWFTSTGRLPWLEDIVIILICLQFRINSAPNSCFPGQWNVRRQRISPWSWREQSCISMLQWILS